MGRSSGVKDVRTANGRLEWSGQIGMGAGVPGQVVQGPCSASRQWTDGSRARGFIG